MDFKGVTPVKQISYLSIGQGVVIDYEKNFDGTLLKVKVRFRPLLFCPDVSLGTT